MTTMSNARPNSIGSKSACTYIGNKNIIRLLKDCRDRLHYIHPEKRKRHRI